MQHSLATVGTLCAYSVDNFSLLGVVASDCTVAQAFAHVASDPFGPHAQYGFAPQGAPLSFPGGSDWPVDTLLFYMAGSDNSEGVDCFSYGSEGCASDGSFSAAVFSDGAAHPGWYPVD